MDRKKSSTPDACVLVTPLRLGALFACQRLGLPGRLGPVAVVRLIVDNDDVLAARDVAADAADHLFWCLAERVLRPVVQDGLREPGGVAALARKKPMIVGDHDPNLAEPLAHLWWQQVPLPEVVVGVGGQQDSQPVADRDSWRDDEKGVAEACVLPILDLVQCLPGNEHAHDNRLAAAGRHLHGHSRQAGVVLGVLLLDEVLDPRVPVLGGHLGEVDGAFDGLALAEEEPLLTGGL